MSVYFPAPRLGATEIHEQPTSMVVLRALLEKTLQGLCDLVLEGSVRNEIAYRYAVEQGCSVKMLVVHEGAHVKNQAAVVPTVAKYGSRLCERRWRSRPHKSRARRLLDRHSSARVVQRRLLSGTDILAPQEGRRWINSLDSIIVAQAAPFSE